MQTFRNIKLLPIFFLGEIILRELFNAEIISGKSNSKAFPCICLTEKIWFAVELPGLKPPW